MTKFWIRLYVSGRLCGIGPYYTRKAAEAALNAEGRKALERQCGAKIVAGGCPGLNLGPYANATKGFRYWRGRV